MTAEHDNSSAVLLARLRRRQPAFTADWERRDADPGDSILAAFSKQLALAYERFDRASGALAREVLGVAGVSLRTSVPARVPVQFRCELATPQGEAFEGLLLPAGSEFEARLADPDPVVFKLEHETGVVPNPELVVATSTPRSITVADAKGLAAGTARVSAFGLPSKSGNALLIGLDGPIEVPTLNFQFDVVEEPANRRADVVVVWEALTANGFEAVQTQRDSTRGLTQSGFVALSTPSEWPLLPLAGATDLGAKRWLRLRLVRGTFRRTPMLVAARVNVATVIAGRLVREQVIEPTVDPVLPSDRRFFLPGISSTSPVDVETVEVEVNEFVGSVDAANDGWMPWSREASLEPVGPDAVAFVVDGATGEVVFGDGRHGRRVPDGFRNVRATFVVISGAASATKAGQRFEPRQPVQGLVEALALANSTGALDERPVDEVSDPSSDRVITAFGGGAIRSQQRAVTLRDLEHLAPSAPGASVDKAVAARGIRVDGAPDRGAVSLFVMRRGPTADSRPLVDQASLNAVEAYLAEVGPPGLDVQVGVPRFVPLAVNAQLLIDRRSEPGAVIISVRTALDGFLNPLTGRNGRWRVGDTVRFGDVVQVISEVRGVVSVSAVALEASGRRVAPCADVVLGPAHLPVPGSHLIDLEDVR